MAFIRQAIEHEIERIQKNRMLAAMKASLKAIKANPDYWMHPEEWQDTTSTHIASGQMKFGGNECNLAGRHLSSQVRLSERRGNW